MVTQQPFFLLLPLMHVYTDLYPEGRGSARARTLVPGYLRQSKNRLNVPTGANHFYTEDLSNRLSVSQFGYLSPFGYFVSESCAL